MFWQKAVFIVLLIFCLTPYGSPPLALALGLEIAFTFGTPFPTLNGKTIEYLLQGSVVLLGFGMDLSAVYKSGKDGFLFTAATIVGTLTLGYIVGRILGVGKKTSVLISSGTAICGGSAIASVGPAIKAAPQDMSVSLGTVFVLNSVALFLFPFIGRLLGMSQRQFGVWSAIAIHDTSSVVGASGTFGPEALVIAAAVKLARALWIVPVTLLFAYLFRDKTGSGKMTVAIPWFILLFLLASVIRTSLPVWIEPSVYESIVNLAKAGMIVTLFLIGTSLSRETFRAVGFRPLLQGVLLWIAISVAALVAVLRILSAQVC